MNCKHWLKMHTATKQNPKDGKYIKINFLQLLLNFSSTQILIYAAVQFWEEHSYAKLKMHD